MKLNVLNRRVHYWLAIGALLPMAVIIASGLLLQAKKHWSWVQPAEHASTIGDPQISIEDMLTASRSVAGMGVTGWDDISRIDVRPDRGLGKVSLVNGWEVQVDLTTGKVLQTAYRRSDLVETIHDGSFFGGDLTKLGIFLPGGIALSLLWLTGVWMAWIPFRNKRRVRRALQARTIGDEAALPD